MSVDRNLYLGHYIVFNIPSKIVEYKAKGCSKCNQKCSSKFCQTCGTEISDISLSKIRDFSVLDIGHIFGLDWDDYLMDIDPMTGERKNIGVINQSKYHLDVDDGFIQDLSHFSVPDPDKNMLELCNLIKGHYGPDCLQIKYGLLQWFS